MQTRREFLVAAGMTLGGLGLSGIVPGQGRAARPPGEIQVRMRSDPSGARVWFDPIGVYTRPGQTIRWVAAENVHTTTAYHPQNDHHSLRIPEKAVPWNSGYLIKPGDHFAVTLTVEGVYDYYCIPHEMAGMVGRIIVGKPTGPGSMPFDYYRGLAGTENWLPVPEAAQRAFPSIERIMREKIVRL